MLVVIATIQILYDFGHQFFLQCPTSTANKPIPYMYLLLSVGLMISVSEDSNSHSSVFVLEIMLFNFNNYLCILAAYCMQDFQFLLLNRV